MFKSDDKSVILRTKIVAPLCFMGLTETVVILNIGIVTYLDLRFFSIRYFKETHSLLYNLTMYMINFIASTDDSEQAYESIINKELYYIELLTCNNACGSEDKYYNFDSNYGKTHRALFQIEIRFYSDVTCSYRHTITIENFF